MSRVLRWLPVRWLLMVAGAIGFSVLLVWLYGLLGNAVWLPVAVAAFAYVEIRLTGISEQMHTDLVEELDHLRRDVSSVPCGKIAPTLEGPDRVCVLHSGHFSEWHQAAGGWRWRALGRNGTEYDRG